MQQVVSIDANTVINQQTGFVVADMAGEKVMMSIENGKYYGLGSVGSRIWELIKTPQTVQDLVRMLLAEYDVSEEKCQTNVITFLCEMQREGLVQFS